MLIATTALTAIATVSVATKAVEKARAVSTGASSTLQSHPHPHPHPAKSTADTLSPSFSTISAIPEEELDTCSGVVVFMILTSLI